MLAEGDPQVYGYMAINWTVLPLRTELTKRREASEQRVVAWLAALTPFSS